MKRIFLLSCVAVLVFVLAGVSIARGATTANLVPSQIGPAPAGSSFTVEVRVENALDLVAWEVQIKVDPNVAKIKSFAEGEFLKRNGGSIISVGPFISSDGGSVMFAIARTGSEPGVSGRGVLGNLLLTLVKEGVVSVSLSSVEFLNSEEVRTAVTNGSNNSLSSNNVLNSTAALAPLPSSGGDREKGGGSYQAPAPPLESAAVSPPVLVEGTTQPQEDVPLQFGEIRGRVVGQTGQVVPRATARIDQTEVKTDSKGVFAFTLVHLGRYTVHYAGPGYIAQTQELEIKAGVVAGAPTVILKSAAKPGSAKISKRVQKAGKKKLRSKRGWKWWRRK